MKNNIHRYKIVALFLVLIAVAFGIGLYYGESQKLPSNSENLSVVKYDIASTTVDMAEFWDVWRLLDSKFVYTHKDAKKVTTQEKIYGAIKGLVATYGDPYTMFLPPEESEIFSTNISGNFEGVGMELGMKEKNIVVVAPLKGTPAYNAGVKTGDILVSIDGKTTANMTVDDAVKLIRGKAGTDVTIDFGREGISKPVKIKITRGVIDIPTTETEVKGDVFIIRLYNFYATSADKFREALREFSQSGKDKLVLDLRGNPGGYLEAAVDMASWFLPMGKVVVRESFGPNIDEQIYRSRGFDAFNSNLKMVILVNEGTASASEILAGALQEQDVAKLVGTKTFGKGSVQELLDLDGKTSLKVTIAKWLTPKGVSISDGGLKPDYEVKITDADIKAGKDPQLEKAIEVLDEK